MKKAKELYPESWKEEQEKGRIFSPYDYQPILCYVFVKFTDYDRNI